MAGNLQPIDQTSAGSVLNPPTYKTFPSNPYGAQNATTAANASFFSANLYTTGSATPSNSGDSLRSFDFIQTQLVGSGTQLGQ